MNTLSRTVIPTRMAVRALLVPSRRMMATATPVNNPPKKEEGKQKDFDAEHPESIENNPKHTHPGSKHALKQEDFGDEASGHNFGNEPVQDKNPAWPR